MTKKISRRRLLALGSAFFGAFGLGTALPARAQNKGNELPYCKNDQHFSAWNVSAYHDDASASSSEIRILRAAEIGSVGFDHNYKRPITYRLVFYTKIPPAHDTFEFTLSRPGASDAKLIKQPQEFKRGDKETKIVFELAELFPEHANPLKQPGPIRIDVANNATLLFSVVLNTNGFADAWQFMRTEQARLEAMEKSKGCKPTGCFITTMCVDLAGLPDDCFELTTLRAFRDGPLRALPGGAADIAHYYEIAPQILAALTARGEERRLLRYYFTHILPCVALARLGLHRPTHALYRDMVRRLERRYL